jgi:hypothetical protein
MALSQWDPDRRARWMIDIVPVYQQRRQSRLLTPYGWFLVLSIISLMIGAVIAFLT